MTDPIWLQELLARTALTDICINGESQVFYDQGEGLTELKQSEDFWTEDGLKNWIMAQLSLTGKTWDARHPFIDLGLPNGNRLHILFPPLSKKGILVSIRKHQGKNHESFWKKSEHFPLLSEIVQNGDSVIISGATGSGKTTLVKELLEAVPKNERIIALEDTSELNPNHPHFLSLTTRPPNADGFGEVNLDDLLRQSLRMRPDRVILGECRGAEVLELLQSLNTGHRGAMATLHANGSRDALRRVELLCHLHARSPMAEKTLRELICGGVRWLVHVQRSQKKREVIEINKVEGIEGDTILLRPMLQQVACPFRRPKKPLAGIGL